MAIPEVLKPFIKDGLSGFVEKFSSTPEQMVSMIAMDSIRNLIGSRRFEDAAQASLVARELVKAAEQLSNACKSAVLGVIESIL